MHSDVRRLPCALSLSLGSSKFGDRRWRRVVSQSLDPTSNKSPAGKINELFSHSLSVDIPLSGGRPDRVRYRDRTFLVRPLSGNRSPKTSLARIICALRCRRRCNRRGQLINSYLGLRVIAPSSVPVLYSSS